MPQLNFTKASADTILGDEALPTEPSQKATTGQQCNMTHLITSNAAIGVKDSHKYPISSKEIQPILSPWPFMKWGMDTVGKMPMALEQQIYILAIADYFTKWIEVETFHQV